MLRFFSSLLVPCGETADMDMLARRSCRCHSCPVRLPFRSASRRSLACSVPLGGLPDDPSQGHLLLVRYVLKRAVYILREADRRSDRCRIVLGLHAFRAPLLALMAACVSVRFTTLHHSGERTMP